MAAKLLPHVLGIDDGPFEKGVSTHVPIVGMMMEGADASQAGQLVRATLRKAQVPEPLRLAHLVARGIVLGESRGRA